MPMAFAVKAYMSAYSASALSRGLPPPWPALVSTRSSTGGPSGAWADWIAAVYLKLWAGITRSSVSAVVIRVAG